MPTLLIAEDNFDLVKALKRKAESLGWEVAVCNDGRELLDLLETAAMPALLLIDINMPNFDGIETIRFLSDLPKSRQVRVRLMTGGLEVNVMAARLIASAKDLHVGCTLYKPFAMSVFADILAHEAALLDDRHQG